MSILTVHVTVFLFSFWPKSHHDALYALLFDFGSRDVFHTLFNKFVRSRNVNRKIK